MDHDQIAKWIKAHPGFSVPEIMTILGLPRQPIRTAIRRSGLQEFIARGQPGPRQRITPKKRKILNALNQHPAATIQALADYAGTSPAYVATTLQEYGFVTSSRWRRRNGRSRRLYDD